MIVFIDSASTENLLVALLDVKGQILIKKIVPAKYKQSDKLLPLIDRFIGGQKKLKLIKGIVTVKGPGSFTALRIGVTTANSLAFALKVPVVGINREEMEIMIEKGLKALKKAKKGKWVVPAYGSEPNITKAKTKN